MRVSSVLFTLSCVCHVNKTKQIKTGFWVVVIIFTVEHHNESQWPMNPIVNCFLFFNTQLESRTFWKKLIDCHYMYDVINYTLHALHVHIFFLIYGGVSRYPLSLTYYPLGFPLPPFPSTLSLPFTPPFQNKTFINLLVKKPSCQNMWNNDGFSLFEMV